MYWFRFRALGQVVQAEFQFGSQLPNAQNLLAWYPQVTITGHRDSPIREVEFGPHWFSSGLTTGIAISNISKGEVVTEAQFLENPDAGPMIAAYAPNVVNLSTGVNDAAVGVGISAEQFKINMQNKINKYLAEVPEVMFVLMGDPDTSPSMMSSAQFAQFDQMAGKLRELALDPANRAVFIDRKRIMKDKYNWTRENNASAPFLIDAVHYSLLGARLLAQEDVAAFLSMGGLISPILISSSP